MAERFGFPPFFFSIPRRLVDVFAALARISRRGPTPRKAGCSVGGGCRPCFCVLLPLKKTRVPGLAALLRLRLHRFCFMCVSHASLCTFGRFDRLQVRNSPMLNLFNVWAIRVTVVTFGP